MKITETLITEVSAIIMKQYNSWDHGALIHDVVRDALKAASEELEREPVWIATIDTEYSGQYEILGHFTGQKHDIEAYLDDPHADLDLMETKHIKSGYANRKAEMIEKRDRLQAEVEDLNRRLKEGNDERQTEISNVSQ